MPGKKNLRMKAARAAAGLSQTDLAEAVGVTRQTLSRRAATIPRSIYAWLSAKRCTSP